MSQITYNVLRDMKLILLILSISSLSSFAADSVEGYKLKVQKAVKSKSLESIKELYSWDGVKPVIKARELMTWKHPFNVFSDKYIFEGVTWTERKDFDEFTKRFIVDSLEVDGYRFSMNHQVIGEARVVWKLADQSVFHSMGIFVAKVDGKFVGVSLRSSVAVKGKEKQELKR